MIVIADLDAFTNTRAGVEEQQARVWTNKVQAVFDYFRKEGSVVNMDKELLAQELLNFDEAEAFASKISQ